MERRLPELQQLTGKKKIQQKRKLNSRKTKRLISNANNTFPTSSNTAKAAQLRSYDMRSCCDGGESLCAMCAG